MVKALLLNIVAFPSTVGFPAPCGFLSNGGAYSKPYLFEKKNRKWLLRIIKIRKAV